ncbi:MAG: hypothetical protein WCV99_10735 [Sterolibacterium sp.]
MAKKSPALVPLQEAPLPSSIGTLADTGLWINSTEFAQIAYINERTAREAVIRAMNGHTWHGTALEVRAVEGIGGKGGKNLQVYIPSLPHELRVIWHKRNPGAMEPPVAVPRQRPAPAIIDLCIGNRVAEIKWKLAIVAPAMGQPKGSEARAAMLKEIAARNHQGLHGKVVQIAVDTLRDWLLKIETDNEECLARRRRSDAGKSRYHVNAKWDKACPLPDTEKRPIAAALEKHIRGLHERLAPERKINSLASAKLQELSINAGWQKAPLIRPGLHLIRKFADSRLPGIRDNDAKLYHDKYRPSIHRSRPSAPMDCVFGDVHPSDILACREDGSEATARMIAWFDWATHDVFYTLVLLPKGKSITQADIIASFIEMVQTWGLPRNLYLDNGSEYLNKAFIAGLEMLQGLCGSFSVHLKNADEIDALMGDGTESTAEDRTGTIRARPYNARAKVIEAFFAWLNKFMALIPGYIGGERMRKKTHNVGKKPKPFPGTFEQLRDGAFAEAVAFYRNDSQGGSMNGKSVNDLKREAYASGWTPPASVDPETLLAAFAEVRSARVETGGVKIKTKNGTEHWYWNDQLVSVMGERIEIRFAEWKPDLALWIKQDGTVVSLRRDTEWAPLDTNGAKEQSRREGLQTRNVSAIRALSSPVDTVADMARYNAALPAPPVTPVGPKIRLGAQTQAIANAFRDSVDTAAAPPVTLPRLSYRDGKTGEIVQPVTLAPQPQPERFDIYAAPPPQKTKPDASADAPGFDIFEELAKNPPLNHQAKETE